MIIIIIRYDYAIIVTVISSFGILSLVPLNYSRIK